MKKKILILAYDFPPYNSMGSQRPYAWFKYFNEFDIEPIVVTRNWDGEFKHGEDYLKASKTKEVVYNKSENGTIIYAPYFPNFRDKIILKYGFQKFVFFRKFLTLFITVFQYLFLFIDNKSTIYKAALQFIKTNKVDYIIATGEPFILFKYAYALSKKSGVPWIADYRDCWSLNFELLNGKAHFFERWYFRIIEKKIVKTAFYLTTPTPLFAEQLDTLFPKKTIKVIQNGFFPEDFEKYIDIPQSKNEVFTISFGGTIYPFQTLEIFLQGLKLFIASGNTNVVVVFYGSSYYERQSKRILSFYTSINSYIKLTPKVNRDTLFTAFKNSDLLLLFDNKKMISGKLYEYLAFNKKILLAGRDYGPMEDILQETNTGLICESPQDVSDALKQCYNEWLTNGFVYCNSKNTQKYSRKEQTQQFVEILKNFR